MFDLSVKSVKTLSTYTAIAEKGVVHAVDTVTISIVNECDYFYCH